MEEKKYYTIDEVDTMIHKSILENAKQIAKDIKSRKVEK